MFCSHCGKEVAKGAVVCIYCGRLAAGVSIDNYARTNSYKNGMAVAGFICSFFSPILGWIFGGIGLKRSRERNEKGKGLSIAAIVIAVINFLLYLALFV